SSDKENLSSTSRGASMASSTWRANVGHFTENRTKSSGACGRGANRKANAPPSHAADHRPEDEEFLAAHDDCRFGRRRLFIAADHRVPALLQLMKQSGFRE